jgi:hypothetical protein
MDKDIVRLDLRDCRVPGYLDGRIDRIQSKRYSIRSSVDGMYGPAVSFRQRGHSKLVRSDE